MMFFKSYCTLLVNFGQVIKFFDQFIDQLTNCKCPVAVRFSKVNRNFRVETKILSQPDVHGRGPVVTSLEQQAIGARIVLGLQVAGFDGDVDGLFRHGTIGCPLATRDGDQISRGDVNNVIANQTLSVLFVWVLDKRTNSRPEKKTIIKMSL
jgi:hypothetical protein